MWAGWVSEMFVETKSERLGVRLEKGQLIYLVRDWLKCLARSWMKFQFGY
jgi:hypothetical protein